MEVGARQREGLIVDDARCRLPASQLIRPTDGRVVGNIAGNQLAELEQGHAAQALLLCGAQCPARDLDDDLIGAKSTDGRLTDAERIQAILEDGNGALDGGRALAGWDVCSG